MSAKRIIVIGGSAAGPKAASKARRMDENAEITIIQKASDLSIASCGYPSSKRLYQCESARRRNCGLAL